MEGEWNLVNGVNAHYLSAVEEPVRSSPLNTNQNYAIYYDFIESSLE